MGISGDKYTRHNTLDLTGVWNGEMAYLGEVQGIRSGLLTVGLLYLMKRHSFKVIVVGGIH